MHENELKTALVTGAGSGIGRDFVLALLENDYNVVLAGRRESSLKETLALSSKGAANATIQSCDIKDITSVRTLFAKVEETYGRLDLLFNNAGISSMSTLLEDIKLEEWQAVIDTNLTGAFLCTQEAFKLMKRQRPMGGRIINNGSISAQVPRPNSAPYTATKHAITGLTKSTALDGRKYNIACGQIDIGNASSAMTEKIESGALQADGTMKAEAAMNVRHVTEALLYMSNLPLDANVLSLTVLATKMPFVGRG